MFSKVWKAVKEVAIAVLLVVGLWLVIGGAYKKDIGNLSDWISATCNIVMAYAAYRAFIFAKDYFTDVIKKDGYEQIKILQMDLIPRYKNNLNLSSINLLDVEVPSYVAGGLGVFQDEDEQSHLPQSLLIDLNDLDSRLKENRRLKSEILKSLKNIETYGWETLPNKKKQLINALTIGDKLFTDIHNIVIYLSEIMNRERPNFTPSFDNDYIKYHDPVKPTSPPCYQDIDFLVEKLVTFQRKLYNPQESTSYDQSINAINLYLSSGNHLKNYFRYTNS